MSNENPKQNWKSDTVYPNLGLTENKLVTENIKKLFYQIIDEKVINAVNYDVVPTKAKNNKPEAETYSFFVTMEEIINKFDGDYVRFYEKLKTEMFNGQKGKLRELVDNIEKFQIKEIIIVPVLHFKQTGNCIIPKNFKKWEDIKVDDVKKVKDYLIKRTNQFQKLATEVIKLDVVKKRDTEKESNIITNKISPF